eukprot:GILJ01002486.1.p1 GENE.GILJ01002486.1~~GILJ01002486.1.p1  ORF type:complete len:254 (+),score=22.69 GILJ01002486.1:41-802(+)
MVLSDLPDEAFFSIFSFLDPQQTCRCTSMSRAVKRLAEADGLWQEFCFRRWSGKHKNPLRDEVHSKEYWPKQKALGKTAKECFTTAEVEGRRTVITRHDLLNNEWNFTWSHEQDKPIRIVFREDPCTTVLLGRTCTWSITPENHVKIDEYPTLSVSRTKAWGWTLSNAYVDICAVDPVTGMRSLSSLGKRTLSPAIAYAWYAYVFHALSDEHADERSRTERIQRFRERVELLQMREQQPVRNVENEPDFVVLE